MAGVLKPNIEGLREEMTDYEVVASYAYNTTMGYGTVKALFDGKTGIGRLELFSLNYAGDYVTVKINKKCNLYRLGYSGTPTQNGPLDITPTTYEKVNSLTSIGWELYVEGLKPGTYTFKNKGAYRGDSEWFFESIPTVSIKIKEAVINTITENNLIKEKLIGTEGEE